MTDELTANADVIVGLHRVLRHPRGGRLQEFRWIHGLEVGLYAPHEGGGDQPYWRILLPENPVLSVCVDLTDHAAGHTVSVPAGMVEPAPRLGWDEPRHFSALRGADIELWNRGNERDRAGEPQGAFSYVIRWADGTTLEGEFSTTWRAACVEGRAFRRPTALFMDEVKTRLREEAGLAPTPERFLRDGFVSEASARQAYLGEVIAQPEVQHRALHILRSCEL